jgi:hypothetical protein
MHGSAVQERAGPGWGLGICRFFIEDESPASVRQMPQWLRCLEQVKF